MQRLDIPPTTRLPPAEGPYRLRPLHELDHDQAEQAAFAERVADLHAAVETEGLFAVEDGDGVGSAGDNGSRAADAEADGGPEDGSSGTGGDGGVSDGGDGGGADQTGGPTPAGPRGDNRVAADVFQWLLRQGVGRNIALVVAQLWETEFRAKAARASADATERGLPVDADGTPPDIGQRAYELYRQGLSEDGEPQILNLEILRNPGPMAEGGWELRRPGDNPDDPPLTEVPPGHVIVPVANVRGRNVIYVLDGSGNVEGFLQQTGLAFLDMAEARAGRADATAEEQAVVQQIFDAFDELYRQQNTNNQRRPNTDLTQEERAQFAEFFVRYLRTGRAPIERLRAAFERAARWLWSLVRGVPNNDIPPAMRSALNLMLVNAPEVATQSFRQETELPLRVLAANIARRSTLNREDLMASVRRLIDLRDRIDALDAAQVGAQSESDESAYRQQMNDLRYQEFLAFLDIMMNDTETYEQRIIANRPPGEARNQSLDRNLEIFLDNERRYHLSDSEATEIQNRVGSYTIDELVVVIPRLEDQIDELERQISGYQANEPSWRNSLFPSFYELNRAGAELDLTAEALRRTSEVRRLLDHFTQVYNDLPVEIRQQFDVIRSEFNLDSVSSDGEAHWIGTGSRTLREVSAIYDALQELVEHTPDELMLQSVEVECRRRDASAQAPAAFRTTWGGNNIESSWAIRVRSYSGVFQPFAVALGGASRIYRCALHPASGASLRRRAHAR